MALLLCAAWLGCAPEGSLQGDQEPTSAGQGAPWPRGHSCAAPQDCQPGLYCGCQLATCPQMLCFPPPQGAVQGQDRDRDAIPDHQDLCPEVPDTDQRDLDGDGLGDACDEDDDNDGLADREDNCPWGHNPDQADQDQDGAGDACTAQVILGPLPELWTPPTLAQINPALYPPPPQQWPKPGRVLVVAPWGDDALGAGTFRSPWRSIHQGLSQARNGDWVVARGGLYPEGPAGHYIAIELTQEHQGVALVAPQGEVALIQPAREGINYGLSVQGDHTLVHGLWLENFPQAGAILGRQGEALRQVTLSRLRVRFETERYTDGIAMVPDNGGAPVIQGALLTQIEVLGASIGVQCNRGPCDDVRMDRIFTQGRGQGESSALDGIAAESGQNYLLTHIEVTQAGADGIDLKVSDAAVVNARVHRVGRNGIKLWHGGDIINAVISHSGADTAVSFATPGRYRLLHSVVAYHNHQGLNSYSLTAGYQQPGQGFEIILQNTAFVRNAGGLYAPPGASVTVDHCLFSEIDNGDMITATSLLDGTHRTWKLAEGVTSLEDHGLGQGNLHAPTAQPCFYAPQRLDYHLPPGSPLIDAGALAPTAPGEDLDHQLRPEGAQPDIGPYEAAP